MDAAESAAVEELHLQAPTDGQSSLTVGDPLGSEDPGPPPPSLGISVCGHMISPTQTRVD